MDFIKIHLIVFFLNILMFILLLFIWYHYTSIFMRKEHVIFHL